MDGYSGYNQVKMAKEDKEKTIFILEWRAYVYNVCLLGYAMPLLSFRK